MTAAVSCAVAVLVMLVISAGLSAHRRRRALRAGEASPLDHYQGLRWSATVRVVAALLALVMLTAIAVADPDPLVDRLFPNADTGMRYSVVLAFHQVLAVTGVGVAAVGVCTDAIVTFVRATALRRPLLAATTLIGVGCAAYGGLFLVALVIS